MRRMNAAVPGIFNQIDGLASHSYPNPGFSQPPSVVSSKSIYSFESELQIAEELSNKKFPVFITETGWSKTNLSDATIADYYKTTFGSAWSNKNVVAVCPFLLKAGGVPFEQFSLIDVNGNESLRFKAICDIPKTKGTPLLTEIKNVLGSQSVVSPLSIKTFKNPKDSGENFKKNAIIFMYNWLLKL